jgi:hypothetical protein
MVGQLSALRDVLSEWEPDDQTPTRTAEADAEDSS